MKYSNRFFVACFFLLTCLAGTTHGQNVPIDFEAAGNGASWNWTVFENGDNPALEIIPNPNMGGINNSATVARFTARQMGAPCAGCESMHGTDIGTFTIDSSNMMINIMVYKSVISDVGIKLVRVDNWSLGEIKIPNTLTNQWEQITFDFSAHLGLTYDQIVIFPDFNARSTENTILFDNVFGPTAIPTGTEGAKHTGLSLYPNPAHNTCQVRAELPIEEIRVYNLLGEVVLQRKMPGHEVTLGLEGLAKGVFVVQAVIEGELYTRRLVRD